MTREFRKLLALLFALTLFAGLILPVFATEGDATDPPAPALTDPPAPEPTQPPEPVPTDPPVSESAEPTSSEPAPQPSEPDGTEVSEPAPQPSEPDGTEVSEPAPQPSQSGEPAPSGSAPSPLPSGPAATEPDAPPLPEPIRADPHALGPAAPKAVTGELQREEGGLHYEIPEDWTAADVISWFIHTYDLDADCFAVSFFCPATGERADWNEDAFFLAGSTYKLPLNMYYYEQEAAGVYSGSTVVGGMPLSAAHAQSLLWSMNEVSESMIYYLGSFYRYKNLMLEHYGGLEEDAVPQGYWANNYYSTGFMVHVLSYLYDRQEDFPELLDYLRQAMPGAYLKKYAGDYDVAHKYGTVDGNFHDVGILYTDDPILVAIYTHNCFGKIYGEDLVGRLGRALADYQTQRTRLNREAAEREETAQPETETAGTEPSDETTAPEAAAPTVPPTAVPEASAPQAEAESAVPWYFYAFPFVILFAGVGAFLLFRKR